MARTVCRRDARALSNTKKKELSTVDGAHLFSTRATLCIEIGWSSPSCAPLQQRGPKGPKAVRRSNAVCAEDAWLDHPDGRGHSGTDPGAARAAWDVPSALRPGSYADASVATDDSHDPAGPADAPAAPPTSRPARSLTPQQLLVAFDLGTIRLPGLRSVGRCAGATAAVAMRRGHRARLDESDAAGFCFFTGRTGGWGSSRLGMPGRSGSRCRGMVPVGGGVPAVLRVDAARACLDGAYAVLDGVDHRNDGGFVAAHVSFGEFGVHLGWPMCQSPSVARSVSRSSRWAACCR
jgi:hypothetical protein